MNMAADYSPLYYVLALPFWELASGASVELRLHSVRVLSILLGVLATAFAYLAAAWAFPGRPWRALAAGALFTLQPSLTQQTSFVTNDALLIATSAAFAWALFRSLRVSPGVRGAALLGALGGLSYLAKPQGAFLLAGVPLLALVLLWQGSGRRKAALLVTVAGAAAAVFGAAGVAGQLLWHGSLSPHGLVKQPAGPHGFQQWLHLYTERDLYHVYWQFVVSAWGDLSWFTTSVPAWVFVVAGVAYLLALAGLPAGVATRRLEAPVVALGLGTAAAVSLSILALEALYFRSHGILILQGRSFLEAMPLFAILLTGGLAALAPRRWEAAACGVVVVAALAANLGSVMVLWDRFYG